MHVHTEEGIQRCDWPVKPHLYECSLPSGPHMQVRLYPKYVHRSDSIYHLLIAVVMEWKATKEVFCMFGGVISEQGSTSVGFKGEARPLGDFNARV